jgi:hypothetical protein
VSPASPARTSQDSQCSRFGCDVEIDSDGSTHCQQCGRVSTSACSALGGTFDPKIDMLEKSIGE